jgi:hypothetical protein
MKFSLTVPTLPLTVPASKVPPEYCGLHQYLRDRYADTVVLSFLEIEDLLDSPLPELAYRREWWMTDAVDGSPSSQSSAWTEANRSARPNLLARNVVFERLSG